MPNLPDLVRDRVTRWGRQATASQIANPGILQWVDPLSDSVVGYRRIGRGAVTVGDPIGPRSELPGVIQRFEAQFKRVVWFGASAQFPVGHRLALPIGFETHASPLEWAQILQSAPALRYQIGRAYRKGVRVDTVDESVDLVACLAEWRSLKAPWRLYFMTDPDIVSDRSQRRAWAAVLNNEVVGYLVASPVGASNRWLFEQWVRRPQAPNGVIEQLVDAAIRSLPADADFTMGLCPFSASPILTTGWRARAFLSVGRWAVRPFYRCQSLAQFKLKFQFPRHDRIQAVFSHWYRVPQSILDVSLAFIIKP